MTKLARRLFLLRQRHYTDQGQHRHDTDDQAGRGSKISTGMTAEQGSNEPANDQQNERQQTARHFQSLVKQEETGR
ncbi:MAG: hypothetical protein ACTHJY_19830 [Rhizobiaceae bacterium]